jgi:hypothetical protein
MGRAYQDLITQAQIVVEGQSTWDGVDLKSVARMRLQNQFTTGLDIATLFQRSKSPCVACEMQG